MNPERWRQVKEIFHAALDLAPEGRPAFLEQRCGGNAGLLDDLRRLLQSHDEAVDFIEDPALVSASKILHTGEGGLWTGRVIGRYRVVREIGRGGMGSVLLATRADEQFEKFVAIKLVRRGMDTEDLLLRFRTERQILASLEHPNIARLLDGGMTEDGLPYLVMEYIEGEPLDKYCDGHELTTNERLLLFRKVCGAVQHAHQNLIIHRDLKPTNILVTATGEPKLLDFGIAKLLDPELAVRHHAPTATLMRLMTPEYASPEQIRGGKITTVSDVYSLGVLLYRLLTGHAPYHFTTYSPQEIERLVCETEPERPSTVVSRGEEIKTGRAMTKVTRATTGEARHERPDALRRRLRGDLDNIVLTALRKESERRYSSAAELSEDLRRYMDGLPVAARNSTWAYRTAKFIGRNRVGASAAALVMLAILGGLTASIWQSRVAARERDQARQEKAKAEQINKFLQSILSAASPEQKGKDAKVIEVLNDASRRLDAEYADQPALRAQALLTIGQTYFDLGLLDEAEKTLREALRLNAGLYGENYPATALSLIVLGQTLEVESKYDEAEGLLHEGVEIERRLSPDAGSKELAIGLFTLGEIDVMRARYESARARLAEALAMSDRISGESNEDSAFMLISLGRVQARSGNLAGAEATLRKSVAAFRLLPQRYEGRKAMALLNLGDTLTIEGKDEEGMSVLLEADAIFEKQDGSFYQYMSKTYLSKVFWKRDDYKRTIEAGTKAIEMGRTLKLEAAPDFIFTLEYLGMALTRTGRAKEAEPLVREALGRARQVFPEGDLATAIAEGSLGECLTARHKFAEAEPLILHSYETLRTTEGGTLQTTEDGKPSSAAGAHERNFDPHEKWRKLASKRALELYTGWKRLDLAAKYHGI
ncbi:MAG: serine/threonine-protein kinase [Pyrinomonadaceae bacterium]